MDKLSAERANELFHYDEDSGILTRKVRTATWTKVGDPVGHLSASDGYLYVRVNYKLYSVHRVIWLIKTGEWPNGFIDHINHDRSDNRWLNLRVVSRAENNRNLTLRKKSISGVTGVSWNKKLGKWEAEIQHNGKREKLGYFEDLEDARVARKSAESRRGFHANHGKRMVGGEL